MVISLADICYHVCTIDKVVLFINIVKYIDMCESIT